MSRKPRIKNWETRCVESLLVKPFILFFWEYMMGCFFAALIRLLHGLRVRMRCKKGIFCGFFRCPPRVRSLSTYASNRWFLQHSFVRGVYTRCPVPIHPSSHPASVHMKHGTQCKQYNVPPECVRAGTPCMEVNTFNANSIKVCSCMRVWGLGG